MKIKVLVTGLMIAVSILSGCSTPAKGVEAFGGTPMPTLQVPTHSSEKAGPLVVTPTRVALGKQVEVKIEDLTPEEMAGLGVALLDPAGARLQSITPLQQRQTLLIPADGQPGAYKVWLAKSSFAADTGINLVVLDVFDAVPPVLRDPDPLKVVETYFKAVSQRDYALAWQALSPRLSSYGRMIWTRGFEPSALSLKLIKITPQQTAPKSGDTVYRCTVELEIQKPAIGIALGTVSRSVSHVTLIRDSSGWRIDRISMLP